VADRVDNTHKRG